MKLSGSVIKYGIIAVALGGFFIYNQNSTSSDNSYASDDIDLNLVLDVTIDTIYGYEDELKALGIEPEGDDAFLGFTEKLSENYNLATPAIYKTKIGVNPQNDASVLAYSDTNGNGELEEGEDVLFLVEIDGEQSRVIASSRSGAVNDHHFSGTSILTGFLLGSMLSRQGAAGVTSKSLAAKKPVTAKAAARARSGSGSHSRGK